MSLQDKRAALFEEENVGRLVLVNNWADMKRLCVTCGVSSAEQRLFVIEGMDYFGFGGAFCPECWDANMGSLKESVNDLTFK